MNTREAWIGYMTNVNDGALRVYDAVSRHSSWPEEITFDQFDYLAKIAAGSFEALQKKRNNFSIKDVAQSDIGYDRHIERCYAECEVVKYLINERGMAFKDAVRYFDTISEKERLAAYVEHFRKFFIRLKLQMLGGELNTEDLSNILGGELNTEDLSNRLVAVISDMKKAKKIGSRQYDAYNSDYRALISLEKLMESYKLYNVNLGALYDCGANISKYNELVNSNCVNGETSSSDGLGTNN